MLGVSEAPSYVKRIELEYIRAVGLVLNQTRSSCSHGRLALSSSLRRPLPLSKKILKCSKSFSRELQANVTSLPVLSLWPVTRLYVLYPVRRWPNSGVVVLASLAAWCSILSALASGPYVLVPILTSRTQTWSPLPAMRSSRIM